MNFPTHLDLHRMLSVGLVLVAFLAFSFVPGRSQSLTSDAPVRLSVSEQKFLKQVIGQTSEQTQLAKLGAERSTSLQIQVYAQQVMRDSNVMTREAVDLLAASGESVGDVGLMESNRSKTVRRVESIDGAEFDRVFLDAIVANHHHISALLAIAEGEREAQGVRGYVSQHHPALRNSLVAAERLVGVRMPEMLVAAP